LNGVVPSARGWEKHASAATSKQFSGKGKRNIRGKRSGRQGPRGNEESESRANAMRQKSLKSAYAAQKNAP